MIALLILEREREYLKLKEKRRLEVGDRRERTHQIGYVNGSAPWNWIRQLSSSLNLLLHQRLLLLVVKKLWERRQASLLLSSSNSLLFRIHGPGGFVGISLLLLYFASSPLIFLLSFLGHKARPIKSFFFFSKTCV